MSTANRIIKNTMFLYIRMGVSIIFNVFTTRFVLQALGASDFGLYNVVGGAIAMLGFVSTALSTATVRFLNIAQGKGNIEDLKRVFNNAVIMHYILALLDIVLFVIAGFFFFNGILTIPEGRLSAALAIYGCLLFSSVYSITIVPYMAAINAHENMFVYSVLGVIEVIAKFLIAVLLLYFSGDRLIIYAILMAIEAWGLRVAYKKYCQRTYLECANTELRKYFDKSTSKDLCSFAGWNMLDITAGTISVFGMGVVVNHFFTTVVNAAFGVATQLSGILMSFSNNMVNAIKPVLFKREAANDRSSVLKITYQGSKVSFLLLSFICIPILLNINNVLRLWLNEVPEWTEIFCALMIIAALFDQITVLLQQTISAEGTIKNYNIVRSTATILSLITSCFILSFFELPPFIVAINWVLFRGFCGFIICLYFCHKLVSLSYINYIKACVIPCSLVIFLSSFIGIVMKYLFNMEFWLVHICLIYIIEIPIYYYIGLNYEERFIILKLIKKTI